MAKEYIDYGYNGSVSLPKEVKNMHNAIIKLGGVPMTAKQFGLVILAVFLAVISFRGLNALGLETLSVLVPIVLAGPCILLAFLKINGLDFDDWLIVMWSNKRQSSAIRKNNSLNEYEKLEDLYDRAKHSAEKKDRKKRLPARNRKQKEFSQYKSFT